MINFAEVEIIQRGKVKPKRHEDDSGWRHQTCIRHKELEKFRNFQDVQNKIYIVASYLTL